MFNISLSVFEHTLYEFVQKNIIKKIMSPLYVFVYHAFIKFGTSIDKHISNNKIINFKNNKIMKRTNLILAVITMITFGFNLNATDRADIVKLNGESLLQTGKYQIRELQGETVEGEYVRKFELNYENGKMPVTIYLRNKAKSTEYIVRSNAMEVKYVAKQKSFGVAHVYGKFAAYSYEANEQFISKAGFATQQIISPNQLSVEDALGLIACYYPELLKNTKWI